MSLNRDIQHIGIAGAGLMGRLLACQLINAGYTVSLFDRDKIPNGSAAGFTAAGMLTPYAEVESAEVMIYQLGLRSLTLWPELLNLFETRPRFHNKGSIVLAHSSDLADLHHFHSHINNKINPTKDQLQSLTHAQMKQLEPELAESFNQGIFLPEESWVSAQDFMQASARYILNKGATWHQQAHIHAVSAHCIATPSHTHTFDLVVDTRGTGAKPQWQDIRGVRGELIWLQAPEIKISRLVRLMHPRYRIYLAPQMQDDLYIVGATQIESDDHSNISVRSCLELLSAVYSIHPNFAEARIVKTDANCRPALIDNLPKVKINDGIIRINGLFRHGYLLAPAISEQVINWLHSKSTPSHNNILDIAI